MSDSADFVAFDFPREIRTERLLLRQWTVADKDRFAAINADPRVMEFYPATASRDESDALFERIQTHIDQRGFGLFAVEIPERTRLAGFVGLIVPRFEAHFTPCVELGWRLALEDWGHGYATEGARAVLAEAFRRLQLDEVVAMTVPTNQRSRRVMEKLGMKHDPADDFDHPLIPDHPLTQHVLYRITRREAADLQAQSARSSRAAIAGGRSSR